MIVDISESEIEIIEDFYWKLIIDNETYTEYNILTDKQKEHIKERLRYLAKIQIKEMIK